VRQQRSKTLHLLRKSSNRDTVSVALVHDDEMHAFERSTHLLGDGAEGPAKHALVLVFEGFGRFLAFVLRGVLDLAQKVLECREGILAHGPTDANRRASERGER